MLSRLALMAYAADLDSQFLDPVPPFDNGDVAAESGVGGRDVANQANPRRVSRRGTSAEQRGPRIQHILTDTRRPP